MDILIGTKNAYKATEMNYFLSDIPNLKVHPYSDLGSTITVAEDQDSLLGNAEKKAREISKATDYYVLTSDGGNDIPGLGDKWDILRNQRIVGEDKTDIEKVNKLLLLMKDLKGEDRRAEYHLALAMAIKGKVIFSTIGITDRGYILDYLPLGEIPSQRWLSQIWYYPAFQKINNSLNKYELARVRRIADNLKNDLQMAVIKISRS